MHCSESSIHAFVGHIHYSYIVIIIIYNIFIVILNFKTSYIKLNNCFSKYVSIHISKYNIQNSIGPILAVERYESSNIQSSLYFQYLLCNLNFVFILQKKKIKFTFYLKFHKNIKVF
jgi:hypothetical protein